MDLTSECSLTVVEKERWTVVLVSMVVLDGTEVPAGEYGTVWWRHSWWSWWKVTVPSWTGEQGVSMGVPACNVLADALTTSVGSEVWACYLSV